MQVTARTGRWTARAASVLGGSVAVAAMGLILARRPVIAGLAAGLGGVLLLGGAALSHADRFLLERTLDSFADRLFDASVLGASAWMLREEEPAASAAALVALAASFLGSYVRARGNSLDYRVEESVITRGIRYGFVSAALLAGMPASILWALAVFLLLAAAVRSSQVAKEERL